LLAVDGETGTYRVEVRPSPEKRCSTFGHRDWSFAFKTGELIDMGICTQIKITALLNPFEIDTVQIGFDCSTLIVGECAGEGEYP